MWGGAAKVAHVLRPVGGKNAGWHVLLLWFRRLLVVPPPTIDYRLSVLNSSSSPHTSFLCGLDVQTHTRGRADSLAVARLERWLGAGSPTRFVERWDFESATYTYRADASGITAKNEMGDSFRHHHGGDETPDSPLVFSVPTSLQEYMSRSASSRNSSSLLM